MTNDPRYRFEVHSRSERLGLWFHRHQNIISALCLLLFCAVVTAFVVIVPEALHGK